MLLLATVILTLHISWANELEITCDSPRFANGGYTPDRTIYKLEDVITYHFQPCDLPEVKHGALYCADLYRSHFPVSLGKWFYYSCDAGYATPTQTQWYYVTCTTAGWSPATPCHRRQTGPSLIWMTPGASEADNLILLSRTLWYIPLFENARAIITGKPFRLNDTLDYQCLDGFKNTDGNPSGSMVCEPAENCGPPPDISNGNITSVPLAVYPSSSRVEYQCQAYYELQETKYVTCSQGEWSEPPRCEEPCVISEEDMNENNIQLKGKHNNTYFAKAGDVIEFTCKLGHSALTSVHSFLALCAKGEVELPRCV